MAGGSFCFFVSWPSKWLSHGCERNWSRTGELVGFSLCRGWRGAGSSGWTAAPHPSPVGVRVCRGGLPQSVPHAVNARVSRPQVLHLYCDTCSVPICRECTVGRHGGHSFVYLQEALQDSRALTIQLLADAQQGRQAIQVSPSTPFTRLPGSSWHRKPFPPPLSDVCRCLGVQWDSDPDKPT